MHCCRHVHVVAGTAMNMYRLFGRAKLQAVRYALTIREKKPRKWAYFFNLTNKTLANSCLIPSAKY